MPCQSVTVSLQPDKVDLLVKWWQQKHMHILILHKYAHIGMWRQTADLTTESQRRDQNSFSLYEPVKLPFPSVWQRCHHTEQDGAPQQDLGPLLSVFVFSGEDCDCLRRPRGCRVLAFLTKYSHAELGYDLSLLWHVDLTDRDKISAQPPNELTVLVNNNYCTDKYF